MLRLTFSVTVLLALVSCGRNATETDVKFAGVGLNPDEIGPEPEYYGGYVEYDWVNFAGGGLTLGALGLQSQDEVGPDLVGFQPPYVAVYGLAFIFDELVAAPDAHHGSIGVPPSKVDTCWTNTEPFAYLSASTAEVGDNFLFHNADDTSYFSLGRIPEIYPPDPQDVFVYYSGIESWLNQPMMHYAPDGDGALEEAVLRPGNFLHGEEVTFEFDGGIPPRQAPVSSIPRPSSSLGEQTMNLPSVVTNLRLSWDGAAWDSSGLPVEGEGSYTTCVQFLGTTLSQAEYDALSADEQAALCGTLPAAPNSETFGGQIYTGPWDTNDGVTFNWDPSVADSEESVTLNIRFLGPIDRDDDSFFVSRVPVEPSADILDQWDFYQNDDRSTYDIDPDASLPQGYRPALACDDDRSEVQGDKIEWLFDPSIETADGDTTVAMQGDPNYNLVEVSCRLADDGEFTLNNEHLATAIAYAQRKDAQGAMFFFSRSVDLDATVPDVRDQSGHRREISPIKVRSHTVDVGRFWLDDSFGQGG